jgi:DNA-binding MarR family transcriptional regulator
MSTISSLPGHLIRRLHQLSTQVFLQRMREAGSDLTPVQFAVLDTLSRHPGVDQTDLALAVAKDRATIGAVADRLAQKGLVRRKVSPRDRRAFELTLTKKGEAAVAAISPIVIELQREILPGLSPAEYDKFVALARKAIGADQLSVE